eukprot:1529132-Rhodomonas_salina.1
MTLPFRKKCSPVPGPAASASVTGTAAAVTKPRDHLRSSSRDTIGMRLAASANSMGNKKKGKTSAKADEAPTAEGEKRKNGEDGAVEDGEAEECEGKGATAQVESEQSEVVGGEAPAGKQDTDSAAVVPRDAADS